MEMQILDNKTQGKVIDKLKDNIKTGTKLSIISAYFTIYAYEELKKELNKIDKLRLLFSELQTTVKWCQQNRCKMPVASLKSCQ